MDKPSTLKEYAQRIGKHPRSPTLYYQRGRLLLKKGYYPRAISDFTQAINLNSRREILNG